MRYSNEVKDQVRHLRSQGLSINEIRSKTDLPISTISNWIQAITLSQEQYAVLTQRTQTALQAGRIRKQAADKEKRLLKEKHLFLSSFNEIKQLNPRELFLTGVSLYWAEGFKNKHEHRLGFCNSDPEMLKFYIYWLEKCMEVKREAIIARLTLNISYKDKTAQIQEYWSQFLGIPLTQFTKPFYQNTQWRKQYSTNEYKGVLRIHAGNSLEHLLKMRGWIQGMKESIV